MTDATYLQFPLCCLFYGDNERERVITLTCYAVFRAGARMFDPPNFKPLIEFLEEKRKNNQLPLGFDRDYIAHGFGLFAAERMGIKFPDFKGAWDRCQSMEEHVFNYEKQHGPDAQVRIKTAFVFSALAGRISYREFAILCGLYSIIGEKAMTRVTVDRVRHRMLGYRTPSIMAADLPYRYDKAKPLTNRQVEYTLAKLHQNRFFARRTARRRFTYYSIRLNPEELGKRAIDRHTYKDFFRANQSAANKAMDDAIDQKRQQTKKSKRKPPPPAE